MKKWRLVGLLAAILAGCESPQQALPVTLLSQSSMLPNAKTTIQPSKHRAVIDMPSAGAYSGTIIVPRGFGAVIRVDVTPGLPAGSPALPSGNRAMVAVRFTGTGKAQLGRTPGFNVKLPRSRHLGNKKVFAAAYANNSWVTVEGPATMKGRNATLAPVPPAMKLLAGHWVQLVIYAGRRL